MLSHSVIMDIDDDIELDKMAFHGSIRSIVHSITSALGCQLLFNRLVKNLTELFLICYPANFSIGTQVCYHTLAFVIFYTITFMASCFM